MKNLYLFSSSSVRVLCFTFFNNATVTMVQRVCWNLCPKKATMYVKVRQIPSQQISTEIACKGLWQSMPARGIVIKASYYNTPNALELCSRMFESLTEIGFKSEKPFDYSFAYHMIMSVKLTDTFIVLTIAILFTILRFATASLAFRPLAHTLRIAAKHRDKWPEAVWKFLVYTCLWLVSLYIVVLSGQYDFLQNPLDIFKDFVFGDSQLEQDVPGDIYWMYSLQLGFYVHSVFATLFMDEWRKDSVMMLVHHALTIFLLEFSFLVRYYKIGTLVLFLHDLSDVLLEGTKAQIYLKDRAGRCWAVHEWLANLGFVCFTISWAWFRLYWYPVKVLYSGSWGVYMHHRNGDPKLVLFFNGMLIALQLLHIYWFYFILLLLYRVATGQQREVEDTREFESAQAVRASGDSRARVHSD